MSGGASTGAAQAGAKRGKRGLTTVLLLPVVVLLLPSCVVLLIGMMPTAVAFMVERGRSKHLATTVGLLNFCGTLPGLVALWEEGQAYATAAHLAMDPFFLLTAFGAAAVGWGIFLTMPVLVSSIYSAVSGHQLARLRRREAHLVSEWGEEVATGGAGETAPPARR